MCLARRLALFALFGLVLGLTGKVRADHPPGLFSIRSAGPINFIAAQGLGHGCWAFGAQTEYVDFERFSDQQLADLAAQARDVENIDYSSVTFLSVAYGLTDEITVVARLPYVQLDDVRDATVAGGNMTFTDQGDPSGQGDLLLLSLIELWESQAGDLRVSAIAGIEAPTGRTDSPSLQGQPFAFEHQAGSRSWDPVFGVTASACQGGWSFHANTTYRWTTEGSSGTDLGDTCNYNAAAVYRFISPCAECPCPRCMAAKGHGWRCHDGRSLDLMVELNGVWQGEHILAGQHDRDSGGHALFVSPGLRISSDHEPWCIYSSCGLPIFQDQNGASRETDIRLVLGVIVNY